VNVAARNAAVRMERRLRSASGIRGLRAFDVEK
jgi:hypothetical protein